MDRAQLATSSRLVCSLVNESLCLAYHYKNEYAILLSKDSTTTEIIPDHLLLEHEQSTHVDLSSYYAILVPIRIPNGTTGKLLLSLDPEEIHSDSKLVLLSLKHQYLSWDPKLIWLVVASWNQIKDTHLVNQIGNELACSVIVQDQIYKITNSKTPSLLTSTAMDWESLIVEGHPTHPMHRTRSVQYPLEFNPETDLESLLNPSIGFARLKRTFVQMNGVWDTLVHKQIQEYLGIKCPEDEVFVPVLALQVQFLQIQFPDLQVIEYMLDNSILARPQSSTRTVVPIDKSFLKGMHCKLSLSMTITSAMRTISPYSVRNGPLMSKIATIANCGNTRFNVLNEVASIGLCNKDEQVAKSLACIIRINPDSLIDSSEELWIVCSALTEKNESHVPHVTCAFGLDTEQKRIAFLTEYCSLLIGAIVPPLIEFGFAWEAHQQNMLVRVNRSTRKVLGFAGRDFGGCAVHLPTFKNATGCNGNMLVNQLIPGSFQIASSLQQCGWIVFHSLIGMHLHRLVRALDLHYCGKGWHIVRTELTTYVSGWVYEQWFTDNLPAKAFLRMKLDRVYRDYIYERVPNVLLTGMTDTELTDLHAGKIG